MWYKNIAGRFFGLVTKHACVRQTDGQNYDSQDRASIAASRGKTAEPIKMPFRLWARMGPRNHVLDGSPEVLRDVANFAIATNFGTQSAITGSFDFCGL